jgi:hypothetical protein
MELVGVLFFAAALAEPKNIFPGSGFGPDYSESFGSAPAPDPSPALDP